MKLRHFLCGTAALLAFAPSPAGEQDFVLDVPLELAGHGLIFARDSGAGYQSVPVFTLGLNAATHLRLGLDLTDAESVPVVLTDPLSGLSYTFVPVVGGALTLGLWDLLGGDAGLQLSFAVEESRLPNVLGLVFPEMGYTFPVSRTAVVGQVGVDADGAPTWTSLGFFNVFAQTNLQSWSGTYRLVDLTASEQSGAGMTNLIGQGWEPLSLSLPTRAMTNGV